MLDSDRPQARTALGSREVAYVLSELAPTTWN